MSQRKITLAEAAIILGVKPQSLRNRMSGQRKVGAPRAYKDPSGRIFFYEEEVQDWFRKRTKAIF